MSHSSRIYLAIVALLAATPVRADVPLVLTSPSIEWPVSDRALPPGPGVDVVRAACVNCHSAGMFLNQPALSKAVWDAEVHKMVKVYKAQLSDEDIGVIVTYLATIKGAK